MGGKIGKYFLLFHAVCGTFFSNISSGSSARLTERKIYPCSAARSARFVLFRRRARRKRSQALRTSIALNLRIGSNSKKRKEFTLHGRAMGRATAAARRPGCLICGERRANGKNGERFRPVFPRRVRDFCTYRHNFALILLSCRHDPTSRIRRLRKDMQTVLLRRQAPQRHYANAAALPARLAKRLYFFAVFLRKSVFIRAILLFLRNIVRRHFCRLNSTAALCSEENSNLLSLTKTGLYHAL